jgi:ABC-type Fe3+/spermidine/putrescine transport system ATPase subunit
MNHGRIEAAGPARAVFARPTSAFVARFFGLNVLEGEVRGRSSDGLEIALAERLIIRAPAIDGVGPGDRVLACVRKEHVRVERTDAPAPTDGAIVAASFLGTAEEYLIELLGVTLRAVRPAAGFARGDRVRVATAAEDWIVLPKE